MAIKYDCFACKKQVTATKNNRYRTHTTGDGGPCENSSADIPEHILAQPVTADDPPDVPREGVDFAKCPQCTRRVKLTRLGYFEPHDQTLKGGDRCPTSGVRAKHARKHEDVLLPGDEPASPIPKVKDSSTPVANRGLAITSRAPGSTSAGANSSPTAPLPTSGPTERPVHEINLERQPMALTREQVAEMDRTETPPLSSGSERDSTPTAPASSASPDGSTATGDAGSATPSSTAPKDPSPASTTTSRPSPPDSPTPPPSTSSGAEEEPAAVGPFHLAPVLGDGSVLQPFSHISQPFPVPPRVRLAESMSDRGKEIAARLRETFYAYTNREHSSNRSAQRTLGPSEIGSPCDRQIAMKMLGITPTNPQEGWAPFVGTAVHAELARMFEWANGAQSGRYVVEMQVSFGHPLVPRGTLDLLDRVLYMVDDHKLMGRWSMDKLVQQGPSETYRTQIQVYGLGAELAGEKVKEVAIIAWPRQESSLDKLYVHVEKYDRKIAKAALDRVSRIAEEVAARNTDAGLDVQQHGLSVARQFPVGDDCKWCPFHLKGDKEMKRGCPGK